MSQRITLPQWIQREKGVTRDVIVENVVRETPRAAVVTLKPVFSAGADHCHRCYRELTHPVSQVVGFGPECCEHLGLPRPTLENAQEWIKNAEEVLGKTSWEVMIPKSTLEKVGFSFADAPVVTVEKPEVPSTIKIEGSKFVVRFAYEYNLKEVVKGVPARFNGSKSDPAWEIKNNRKNYEGVKNLIENHGFIADYEILGLIYDPTVEQSQQDMLALSSAVTTDLQVDVDGLFDFQRVAVEYITKSKRVILGDTMGLGKTAEILATAEKNNAYPMLVICPASLKYNWANEAEKWVPHRSVEVLNGSKQANYNAEILIINYDILASGWEGDKKAQKESKKKGKFVPTVHTTELAKLDLKMVAMDEGHYVKDKGAQRSRATKYLTAGTPSGRAAGSLAVREGVEFRVWATGTPVLNRPAELIFPLEILDRLDELGGFNDFTYRYCARENTPWGMDISGSSNEDELNKLMRSSFYIRRTKADVLDELPPKVWADQYVHIDNRDEYDYAEEELISYVADRAVRNPEFLEQIAELEDDEQDLAMQAESMRAAGKAEQAEVLVRLGNLRRLTAEGKLASSIAWIEDFLKNGEKLIVFANHRKVVNAIADHFNAPKIMGGMSAKKIEQGKADFQEGDAQLIVLNIKAGGVGHTLTAAHHIAFVEFPWSPGDMDQAIDRAYARMNDIHGVTVWQVVAEDTMDQTLMAMINNKREVVEAITEGRERAGSTNFMNLLMEGR